MFRKIDSDGKPSLLCFIMKDLVRLTLIFFPILMHIPAYTVIIVAPTYQKHL